MALLAPDPHEGNTNDMNTGTLLDIAIKSAPRQPMRTLTETTVSETNGLAGDSRGTVGHRQVTLVDRDAWERACNDVGTTLPWTVRRANLLLEGVALQETAGRTLRVGDVLLEVTGETLPCARMDEAHAGLKEALAPEWRGGVTARVVAGGTLRLGDEASWVEAGDAAG